MPYPGEVIAYRGDYLLIYDGVEEDGMTLGHVRGPNGVDYPTNYIASIVGRGFWEPVKPPEINKSVIVLLPVQKHPKHPDQQVHAGSRGGMEKIPTANPKTRSATPGDIERIGRDHNYKVPSHWVDVQVPEDADSYLVVKGKDANGKWHYVYTAERIQQQSDKKWQRVAELDSAMPKLDSRLDTDLGKMDADATVVGIMRHTGCRVGDESAIRGRLVKDATYGASTLRAKHVTVNESGSVSLDFVGKDGVRQRYLIKDPKLAAAIAHHAQGKSRNDPLFPSTSDASTMKYLREATGLPNAKNHDLRTHMANAVALASKGKRPPKTKKEFQERRKAIGEKVAKQLGNTPAVALSTYVNPIVFADWMKPEWQ